MAHRQSWEAGVVIAGWMLCGGAGCNSSPTTVPSDSEQRILALENEGCQRWRDKDLAFFERFLADDVVMNRLDGTLRSKAEYLAGLKGEHQVDRCAIEQIQVRMHGPTAVVTGVTHAAGVVAGKPFAADFRFIDTFHWTGERWVNVAWASTPLATSAKGKANPAGSTP